MDMDVERFKIAGGLIGVTAQRLVRKLCPACAGEVEASSLSPLLENMLRQHGLPTVVRQPVGCAACDHSGYRGRFCLVELLEIREELRDLIGSGTGAEKLREAALAAGALHTMKKDILRHLSAGTTSFEEIQTYLELKAGGAEAPSDARVPEPRRPEPAVSATPTPAVSVSTPPVAVLVTDDEAVRKTLHEILAEKGFQIAAPPDGQVAVAMVARSNPSLLLVGPPFARTDEAGLIPVVRSVLGMRDLPVMALTESEEEAEGILAAGADEYLVLPLRPGTARKRLESLMRRNEGWSPLEDVMRPITPAGEQKRLEDLRSTGMLDTAEEERFDRLTRKAAEQFEVPISLVSLVDEDRQWFKSHYGLESRQTPRDVSFCGHAVLGEEVFVVEDSYLDPRFSFNPLVTGEPHIRFYAGYPLRGPAGQRIGSFCIVDHKPRTMSATERGALETLGREVEQELGRAADTG
jgi:DNA-binding response OmpR family regulator